MNKPSPRQCPAWSHNRECACHLSSASPQLLSARFQSSMWCCPFERAQKSCLVKYARTLWKRKSWHFSDWRKISPHFPFSLFQTRKMFTFNEDLMRFRERPTGAYSLKPSANKTAHFKLISLQNWYPAVNARGRVAKCQFFYTDHFCPTKFTPRKSA